MGYKDFTQKEENEQSVDVKEKVIIKSQLLQQLHKTVTIYPTFNLVQVFPDSRKVNFKISSSLFLRRTHCGIEHV